MPENHIFRGHQLTSCVIYRFLPKLEFRYDALTREQREVERVFRELDIEDDRDKLEAATKKVYEESRPD